MTAYVALLRAVNVGGTGKLPMEELRAIGLDCGFANVRTFIASGNLLFDSDGDEQAVREAVEARLEARFGRIDVFVRDGAAMAAVAAGNPFGDRPGNRVVAYFLAGDASADMIERTRGIAGETMALGSRALYIAYGDDMGHSKLRLHADTIGTARNMNSVAKIAALLK